MFETQLVDGRLVSVNWFRWCLQVEKSEAVAVFVELDKIAACSSEFKRGQVEMLQSFIVGNTVRTHVVVCVQQDLICSTCDKAYHYELVIPKKMRTCEHTFCSN